MLKWLKVLGSIGVYLYEFIDELRVETRVNREIAKRTLYSPTTSQKAGR